MIHSPLMDGGPIFSDSDDTPSAHDTLDAVVGRVATHPETVGAAVLGSAATGVMTDASNYDLLVVLDDAPTPLTLILTRIEGRVAEVVLMTRGELERVITALSSATGGSREVGLAHRLADSRILAERDAALTRARARARHYLAHLSVSAAEQYDAWFDINYAWRMLAPMLVADDPEHQRAARYRMHAQIGDLCTHYFTIRGLPWRGEKAAFRHLRQYDPAFLALLDAFLTTSDPREKARQYRELALRALAPVGGLWDEGAVVADAPVEQAGAILAVWDRLVSPHAVSS